MGKPRRKRVWVDWTPDIANLFGSFAEVWKAPAKVHIDGHLKGFTVSARFISPDGNAVTCRVRVRRDHHAGFAISDTSIHAAAVVSGERS